MIWRILGIIGAGSFFLNGFSLLSNPNCVSADFGGGRVVQVTCRQDTYGTFTGTQAGLISVLIGAGILGVLFLKQILRWFKKPMPYAPWENPLANSPTMYSQGLKSMRICDKCEFSVPEKSENCPNCGRFYFDNHKTSVQAINSELKICDNCKSEIHNFYPKCFNCEGTSFTQKKSESIPEFRTPETKTCPMCAEEIKYAAKKCRYCQHLMTE